MGETHVGNPWATLQWMSEHVRCQQVEIRGRVYCADHELEAITEALCFDGHGRRTMADYDIALRVDELHPDEMDDIVVKNVSMFRAEAMSDKSWWMSCFLADGQEVVFWVTIEKKRLVVRCTDQPSHGYVYEDDEIRAETRAEIERRVAAAKAKALDNDGSTDAPNADPHQFDGSDDAHGR